MERVKRSRYRRSGSLVKKNPIAKELITSGKFQQRVIASRKKYNRKKNPVDFFEALRYNLSMVDED